MRLFHKNGDWYLYGKCLKRGSYTWLCLGIHLSTPQSPRNGIAFHVASKVKISNILEYFKLLGDKIASNKRLAWSWLNSPKYLSTVKLSLFSDVDKTKTRSSYSQNCWELWKWLKWRTPVSIVIFTAIKFLIHCHQMSVFWWLVTIAASTATYGEQAETISTVLQCNGFVFTCRNKNTYCITKGWFWFSHTSTSMTTSLYSRWSEILLLGPSVYGFNP